MANPRTLRQRGPIGQDVEPTPAPKKQTIPVGTAIGVLVGLLVLSSMKRAR